MERGILRRIDEVDPAGNDADRAGLKRDLMRGCVDSPRQPRHDDRTGGAKIACKLRREFPSDR